MLCACIDIGSNTTRVLVADVVDGRLREVLQQRAFTRIGKGLKGGEIPREKIAEVARVVAEQRAIVDQLGCVALRVVATAAIRNADNAAEFTAALRGEGGVDVEVLDGAEEARLAFAGATRTLGEPLAGSVGVVDVGGGSTELAIGTLAGGATWSESFRVGSGLLTDHYRRSDPPSAAELHAMREYAHGVFEGLDLPPGRRRGGGRRQRRLAAPAGRRHARRRLAATRHAGAGGRAGGRRGAAFLDRPGTGAADAGGADGARCGRRRVRPAADDRARGFTGRCHLRARRE